MMSEIQRWECSKGHVTYGNPIIYPSLSLGEPRAVCIVCVRAAAKLLHPGGSTL